jgi:hypothetical protein
MPRTVGPGRMLAVATLLASTFPASAAAGCAIDDLLFLQGDWHYSYGSDTGAERWVLTAAHSLAGSSWEARGAALSFMEISLILPAGERIELRVRHFDGSLKHAWEDQDSPMIFALAQCDGHSALFDGTGTHAGEHISYRSSAQVLTFIGDFLHQGKPVHVEVNMSKASH